MIVTKEILEIKEAFRVLLLEHESEDCALEMVKEVLREARKRENKELDLMNILITFYGGGILRKVTNAEVEVYELDSNPYFVSLV